jgi:hypothetical protein
MKTGALIFAFNNEQIDYVSMAQWSAQNIERHLGIPTCIITNKDVETVGTNQRWFGDYNTNVTWHNESRTDAYTLSPWDRTLVLDADYVVASDQLKTVLDSDQDFLAHRLAYDIVGINDFAGLNYFGNNQMPMWWATVMMFRRSTQAQLIFECMSMVKNNWTHYKKLYKNHSPSYRNDHALTIALGIVNGHTLNHTGISWNLASLTPEHKLTQLDADEYRVDFLTPDQKPRWITIKNQDFHAMGKQQLGAIVANPC